MAKHEAGRDKYGHFVLFDGSFRSAMPDEKTAKQCAAAPDLYEALKDLMPLLDAVPVFQLDDGKTSVKAVRLASRFMKALDQARAALAKVSA